MRFARRDAGGRFYGFVNGGALAASVAASWMVAAWDQNAALRVMSPAAAAFEDVALGWVREILGLPVGCGGAIVTGATVVVAGAGLMGAALAHSAAHAGADVVIASRDVNRASRLARRYAGRGVDLRAGAEETADAAGVAVALGGPWAELEPMAGRTLPPIADISAPQAVPEAVRRHVNGSFLGIDDLYRQSRPLPGAYIEDARRLVDARTAELGAWLEGKA
jgi:glutamyl-tRNA reductase